MDFLCMSEDEGIIPIQHDIPFDSPKDVNFSFLEPEKKDIEDGDFEILPIEKHDEFGYEYIVQFNGEETQQHLYLHTISHMRRGWCRCEDFTENHVCRDLYAVHLWENGAVEAANQDTAEAAIEKLERE